MRTAPRRQAAATSTAEAVALLYQLPRVQCEVLLGTLVGDGHLACPLHLGARGRLQMTHAVGQADYLEWKAREIGAPGARLCRDGRRTLQWWTPAHPLWRSLRPLFWSRWGRVLPAALAPLFGPLALLVWCLDDGTPATRGPGFYLSLARYGPDNVRAFWETASAWHDFPALHLAYQGRYLSGLLAAPAMRALFPRWRSLPGSEGYEELRSLPDLFYRKAGRFLA